jgi:DNA processing protein
VIDGSQQTGGSRLSEEQLVDWLRLIRSENVGPRTFRALINRFGGVRAALDALPELIARSTQSRAVRIADRDDILREIERSRAAGVRFVASSDPDYPALLREIDSAPPVIALRGDAALLSRDCVAIVGSRNASAAGLALTERLAHGLARENYVIVSGLARGVDGAAHRAALDTGTIAVLAGGHARPYPSEHASLLEQIAQRGAVVSEMPLEWEPRGRDFPRRNRIVSGLCQGIVVVEAARRSGSLITARFAAEQGREVFAAPGSPLDPRAEGTNDLLRQGASFCTSAEDVIRSLESRTPGAVRRGDLFGEMERYPESEPLFDEIDLFSLQEAATSTRELRGPPAESGGHSRLPFMANSDRGEPVPAADPPAGDLREIVMALLGPSPVGVDELIRAASLPARDVHGLLLELDMEGRLERHGGNAISLRVSGTSFEGERRF